MTLRCLALSAATVLLGACARAPTAQSPPDSGVILGEWNYASAALCSEVPCLNTGLRVSIRIESLEATQFRGHVTMWFAGDVGTPPAAFDPVTGTIDEAGAVTMRIPYIDFGALAITLVASVAGDVLTVHESQRGHEPGPFPDGGVFQRSPA